MRIMGLDVGDKRIGVAVSDPLGITAQGLCTVVRAGTAADIEKLREIADAHGVEKVVVGLPKNMDGSIGPQGQKTLSFAKIVGKRLGLPVREWDERLTTVEAERMLVDEADVSRRKRKQVIDTVAAVLILQNFLDATR